MANILIVDDALFMRTMMTKILTENGYNVIGEARDGNEAVEMYKKLNPDLVTLDITMPIKNGIEALREIKQYDQKAKVIMCSAMGQQQMLVKAISLGASDFVVKPFEKDRLLDSINRILND